VASLSAFAGCAPVAPRHEGARAVPVEPLAAVSLTVWPGRGAALAEALRAGFGLTLPEAGRWTHAGDLVAVWLGPEHFSLQREGTAALWQDLMPVVGDHAALIDLTDARATLRLTGPDSRQILAGLLPIDLHLRAFAPGRAATTIASHMTVQVRQLDAAPSYDLAVGRSFAGSLWRALELTGAGRLRLG
jgi:heterotetrameric sarcosine oxidase gamma subunit